MLLVKYKWLWQLQNQNFRFKVTHSSWCYTGLYKDVKSSFVNSRDEMVKMTWSACSQGSFIARQTPSIIFVWAPSINAVHTESASSHHTQLHHLDPWCCGRDRSLWRSGTAVPLARLITIFLSSIRRWWMVKKIPRAVIASGSAALHPKHTLSSPMLTNVFLPCSVCYYQWQDAVYKCWSLLDFYYNYFKWCTNTWKIDRKGFVVVVVWEAAP